MAADHVVLLQLMDDIKKNDDYDTLAKNVVKLAVDMKEHLAEEEAIIPKAVNKYTK